jgi:mono/diheme cytochrome c family protein
VDRRRAFTTLLIGVTGLIGVAGLAEGRSASDIREAAWTQPGARLAVLTTEPGECLTLPSDREARALVALGRQLFRTPLLLGGQAARAGLSCASCHRSGRGNPDFLFPGLSGAAGTADVTSSFMSHSRGDGQYNPKPIPDLGRDLPRIGRDPATHALDDFLRGLVVEEFDGPPPSDRSMRALAAYVRAVTPLACAAPVGRPISLHVHVGEMMLGLAVVRREAERDDQADMRLVIGGLRDQLGQISARFAPLPKRQAALAGLDRRLAKLQNLAERDPDRFISALEKWQARFAALIPLLARDEPKSLFDPELLRESL